MNDRACTTVMRRVERWLRTRTGYYAPRWFWGCIGFVVAVEGARGFATVVGWLL